MYLSLAVVNCAYKLNILQSPQHVQNKRKKLKPDIYPLEMPFSQFSTKCESLPSDTTPYKQHKLYMASRCWQGPWTRNCDVRTLSICFKGVMLYSRDIKHRKHQISVVYFTAQWIRKAMAGEVGNASMALATSLASMVATFLRQRSDTTIKRPLV